MIFRKITAAALITLSLAACKEVPPTNPAQEGSRETIANESLRQVSLSEESGDITCSEQCGLEARSGVYKECMADGGDRQDCGVTGREWYRECIASRCDASAVFPLLA